METDKPLWEEIKAFCVKERTAIIVIAGGVFVVWMLLPGIILIASSCFESFDSKVSIPTAGQIGDVFGAVNSLFAGLAFAGLILTLILQMKELRNNTHELKQSANALQTQVQLMAHTARLSALPDLIAGEVQDITVLTTRVKHLTELSSKMREQLKTDLLTSEGIRKRIEESKRMIDGLNERHSIDYEEHLQVLKRTIEGLERLKKYKADIESIYDELSGAAGRETRT